MPLRVVYRLVAAPVVGAVTGMLFQASSLLLHSKRVTTMTAPHIVDPYEQLTKAIGDASPDLLRTLMHTTINMLLSADADAVVGAEYGVPSPDQVSQRNGYRTRPLDTRLGTIDVHVPKLRSGTYFPEWLLERRKRSESALITVVADCSLAGVSTRRMDKLAKTLGIHTLSRSQVSRMAEQLKEHVTQFRHRPLGDAGPFSLVAADALTIKVREGGIVVNTVVMIATGVNADGRVLSPTVKCDSFRREHLKRLPVGTCFSLTRC